MFNWNHQPHISHVSRTSHTFFSLGHTHTHIHTHSKSQISCKGGKQETAAGTEFSAPVSCTIVVVVSFGG